MVATTPASPPAGAPRAAAAATALAFVAGYVDTLGFVALFGLFTAHVTGNFVLIGKVLVSASGGGGLAIKLLAFPAFVLGVMLAHAATRWHETRARDPIAPLLWAQAALLLAFAAAGVIAAPLADADTPAALVAGALGALAMGMQNGQARLALAALTPTTVMTGNVTQLVIDLLDLRRLPAAARGPVRARLAKMAPPVAGFAIGALGGAYAFLLAGFPALALPALVLIALPRWLRAPSGATPDAR